MVCVCALIYQGTYTNNDAINRSCSQRRYAPAGARQFFRVNFGKLLARELRPCSRLSQSWLIREPNIRSLNKIVSALCTSRSTSCTSSSSPTANRISYKTLTAFICSPKLLPAFAGIWMRGRFCAMPSSCSARSTNWSHWATGRI